ncbi:MAG: hypothetical protein Q4E68_10495 [Prevotellaceae bacterium]|nr:hypothetical protein [Prevotellaceae bacterium]
MLLDLVRGTRFITVLLKATISQYSGLKAIPIDHPNCETSCEHHTYITYILWKENIGILIINPPCSQ